MRLLHFVPAYRSSVHVAVVHEALATMVQAETLGDVYGFQFADVIAVARARNIAAASALKMGADLLYFQDADTFGASAGSCYRILRESLMAHDAAVVGAAYVHRHGDAMCCSPMRPGEVYDGECGTGLMLIDVRRLRDVPLPWFDYKLTPDGTDCELGEDIGFCRAMKAAGHRVMVDARIGTVHCGTRNLYFPGTP